MTNTKRTFILGLGHQKCGTSWLYKYMCQSEKFARGFAKEYYIWDRKDMPLFANNIWPNPNNSILLKKRRRRYLMEESDEYYFRYFDEIMSGSKVLSADLTPSYSGLKSDRLRYIKRTFLEIGIEIKVVILVREPLSRIKSAVRFNLDRGNYSEGILINETDFERALNQYYKSKHCEVFTNYINAISEASSIFPQNSIYIGFYETMFESCEVNRLSRFLQIDTDVAFANVRVNKTKTPVVITESDSRVKEHYSRVYQYFYKNYPVANDLWK